MTTGLNSLIENLHQRIIELESRTGSIPRTNYPTPTTYIATLSADPSVITLDQSRALPGQSEDPMQNRLDQRGWEEPVRRRERARPQEETETDPQPTRLEEEFFNRTEAETHD